MRLHDREKALKGWGAAQLIGWGEGRAEGATFELQGKDLRRGRDGRLWVRSGSQASGQAQGPLLGAGKIDLIRECCIVPVLAQREAWLLSCCRRLSIG